MPPPLPDNSGTYPRLTNFAGPKKETARISTLPEPPPPKPVVNMAKTQPLIKNPTAEAPVAAITVAPSIASPSPGLAAVSTLFLWALAALSFVVFLIQLWNYFSV